jgi:hypothetical protein
VRGSSGVPHHLELKLVIMKKNPVHGEEDHPMIGEEEIGKKMNFYPCNPGKF